MRVKKGFILRDVAGEKVIVPTGALAKDHPNLIVLTESAALLWEILQEEFTQEQLKEETLKNYKHADPEEVDNDICEFIEFLRRSDILEC